MRLPCGTPNQHISAQKTPQPPPVSPYTQRSYVRIACSNASLAVHSDKTCRIWSTDTGESLQILEGHIDEIFSCAFNYEGDTIITGSKDNTCRIWKC